MLEEHISDTKKMKTYFSKKDALRLRKLSGHLLTQFVITEDSTFLEQSYVAYALAKLISKPHYLGYREWDRFKSKVTETLESGIRLLEKGNIKNYIKKLTTLSSEIEKIDEGLGHYVSNVLEKAHLRNANHLYASGMSLSKAAEITKISEQELLTYSGATKMHEVDVIKSIRERLKAIKKLEGKK